MLGETEATKVILSLNTEFFQHIFLDCFLSARGCASYMGLEFNETDCT